MINCKSSILSSLHHGKLSLGMISWNLNENTCWVHNWTQKLVSHPMMLISKLTLISSMLIFSLILKVRGGIKISVLKHHLEFLYKNSWYIVLDSETLKHRSPKCHNYQVKLPKMTVEHRSQRIICACAPVGGSQWFAMWASLPNLISLPQSCEASPVLL